MEGYLGETKLDWKQIPEFKDFTYSDWTLYFIDRYGLIEGSHHKQWLLDIIARINNGCKIELKQAKWKDGTFEFRVDVLDDSKKYKDWVKEWEEDDEGEICNQWLENDGIAP